MENLEGHLTGCTLILSESLRYVMRFKTYSMQHVVDYGLDQVLFGPDAQ